MIDILKKQFTKDMSADEKLNRVRELLQLTALKIIYDKDFFKNVAFVGGTALRVLFDLRRFSEDLDFSLIDKKGYDFSIVNSEIIRGFKLYGLNVESRPKDEKNVNSAFLKFSGLLKELGLSNLKDQKLSVKLEIDTDPPAGAHIESTIVNKTYIINLIHPDISSLYATKLHACFFRKYLKGRDFYDFIWYLGRKARPNFKLLNNAITQTQGANPGIKEENFRAFLLRKIEKVNFDEAKKDVERFLEDKSELKLFNAGLIKQTIESTY